MSGSRDQGPVNLKHVKYHAQVENYRLFFLMGHFMTAVPHCSLSCEIFMARSAIFSRKCGDNWNGWATKGARLRAGTATLTPIKLPRDSGDDQGASHEVLGDADAHVEE